MPVLVRVAFKMRSHLKSFCFEDSTIFISHRVCPCSYYFVLRFVSASFSFIFQCWFQMMKFLFFFKCFSDTDQEQFSCSRLSCSTGSKLVNDYDRVPCHILKPSSATIQPQTPFRSLPKKIDSQTMKQFTGGPCSDFSQQRGSLQCQSKDCLMNNA